MESLRKSFNDNALGSEWTKGGTDSSQVVIANNVLKISHTAGAQYNQLDANTTYDLTSSYALVQVVDAGDQAITSHETGIAFRLDGSNELWFFIGNGFLRAYKNVAGAGGVQLGTGLAYVVGTHRWLRLREAAGTIYYDWSTNAYEWFNYQTLANPFAVTALTPRIFCDNWQAEASGSYGIFDNFNVLPKFKFNNSGLRPHPFSPGVAR